MEASSPPLVSPESSDTEEEEKTRDDHDSSSSSIVTTEDEDEAFENAAFKCVQCKSIFDDLNGLIKHSDETKHKFDGWDDDPI